MFPSQAVSTSPPLDGFLFQRDVFCLMRRHTPCKHQMANGRLPHVCRNWARSVRHTDCPRSLLSEPISPMLWVECSVIVARSMAIAAHLPVPSPRHEPRGASGDIRQRLAEWQKRERFYVWPFATQPIRSSVVQGTAAIFSHQGTKVEMAAMSLEGNTCLQFQKSVATLAHPLPPHRRSGARSGHARACSDRTRGPGALD